MNGSRKLRIRRRIWPRVLLPLLALALIPVLWYALNHHHLPVIDSPGWNTLDALDARRQNLHLNALFLMTYQFNRLRTGPP